MIHAMPTQSLAPLLDRLMDGTLTEWLTNERAAGVTFSDMAVNLREQYDVKLTGETLRGWCIERDIPTSRDNTEAAP